MRAWWLCSWLGVAGCDQVLMLERPVAPACPPPPVMTCGVAASDEDGDGIADTCDPCPQFDGMGTVERDGDSDGVGDRCDLAPDLPATCRSRFFYGFDTSTGWTDTAGWDFGGQASLVEGGLHVLQSTESHLSGRATAAVDNGEGPGVDDSLAGVVMLARADHAYGCAINQASGGARGTLVLLEIDLATSTDVVVMRGEPNSFAVTPGLRHRVSLELRPDGELECMSIGEENGSVDDLLTTRPRMSPVPGTVGLVARTTNASFDYLDFVPF